MMMCVYNCFYFWADLMNLDYLQTSSGPDVFYTPEAIIVIEDHLTYLRTHSETTRITLEPHTCYKYHGDLSGLLSFAKIQPYLHYVVMRMNFMSSPTDYDSTTNELLTPADNVVNKIIKSFQTHKKILL